MARALFAVACLVVVSALKTQHQSGASKLQATKAEPKGNAKLLVSDAAAMESQQELYSGRTEAERAAMPKFVLKMTNGGRAFDGIQWGKYRWSQDNVGLNNHPARVNNTDDAQFVITCCLDKTTTGSFNKLPKRSPESPYLIKVLDFKKDVKKVLESRDDFYALNYDMRDGLNNSDAPVRGVTIAPHNYFRGRIPSPTTPRKYLLTFQGRKTSELRGKLHKAFANSTYGKWKNISIETILDRNAAPNPRKFYEKMDTIYALTPLGDDRWSLRFSEVIGAGAIPVILADGLTLPYENTIDWKGAVLRLPESYASDPDKLMSALPSDPETITKMRKAVYDINRKYFATPDARADAMLLDASSLVSKKGKYKPVWDSNDPMWGM